MSAALFGEKVLLIRFHVWMMNTDGTEMIRTARKISVPLKHGAEKDGSARRTAKLAARTAMNPINDS